MKAETRGWIASAILAPICLVVLSWTLVIFHTNRRKWQSKDLIISTLITQGIAKQIATFLYALIVLLKPIEYFDTHCGCVKWLITSIDIFQAATIGTLIVTRLLAVRFPSRFRAISKRTHLYYHMITLGILSSCIGIASILAEKSHEDTTESEDVKYCTFLPYELNPKYAVLSISLNALVDLATVVALVWTIYAFCRNRRLAAALAKNGSNPSTIRPGNAQRHGLMTSSSDLSQLSDASLRSLQNAGDRYQNRNPRNEYSSSRETNFGQYLSSNNGKVQRPIVRGMLDSRNLVPTFQNGDNFYGDASIGKSSSDTLKSSKLIHNYHQLLNGSKATSQAANCDEMFAPTRVNRWASESSYLSTSTSSTNSRTPCLVRQPIREENLGIATTVAIFLLCFICNHLPFLLITITGTFWPGLLPLWPLNAYLLWAGLLQDCLLPIVLAGVDRNFKMWLRQIYARQHRTPLAKHQGLDGKFRVFNTPLQSMQPMQLIHNEPIKFPITNGSLFSSVDGRLPIIHNYRRGPGQRTNGLLASHCISAGLPGALRRVAFTPRTQVEERKQRMDEANYRLHVAGNFPSDNANSAMAAGSSFEDTERRTIQEIFRANLRNSMRMQEFRLSNMDLEPFRSDTLDRSEFDGSNEFGSEPIYATLSSRSCCSATTAANDDFEFYQNDSHEITDAVNCTVLVNQFAGIGVQSCGMHGRESVLATLDQSSLAEMADGERQIAETQHESHVSIEPNSLESDALQEEFPKHDTGVVERESQPFLLHTNQITLDNKNLKIDQCLLRLHDHHISVLDRMPSHHPPLIREENETDDSMVLESFNNLKHLHDLRRTNESENVTIQKFKDDSIFTDTMSESVSVSSLDFSTDDTLQDTSSSAQDFTKLSAAFHLYDADVPARKSKRRLYKKTPLNRRYLEPQSTKRLNTPPTNRRLMKPKRVEKTPPLCRRSLEAARAAPPPSPGLRRREFPSRRTRTKKLLPVLSVDSLSAALNDAGVSYLDNGDLWRHGRQEMGGSVPDFKKIFVSDFI